MNATERLLVLCTLASPQPDERAEAARLVGEGVDWDLFQTLAEANATAPLVWKMVAALGQQDRVPPAVRARFEERAAAIRDANEARLKNARDLFARFARRHIDVVILKGVLFAETIYRDPYYKKMNDVDILIRVRDLDAVYEIFQELRYFCAAELVGEINGWLDVRSGDPPPGTDSRGIFRVGSRYTIGGWRGDVSLFFGLTSNDPAVGFGAGFTYVFNAFSVP